MCLIIVHCTLRLRGCGLGLSGLETVRAMDASLSLLLTLSF